MMLRKTLKKFGETMDAMKEEINAVFQTDGDLNVAGGDMVSTSGNLVVRVKNGNVEIKGPIKELRINGKLVRFKEKP